MSSFIEPSEVFCLPLWWSFVPIFCMGRFVSRMALSAPRLARCGNPAHLLHHRINASTLPTPGQLVLVPTSTSETARAQPIKHRDGGGSADTSRSTSTNGSTDRDSAGQRRVGWTCAGRDQCYYGFGAGSEAVRDGQIADVQF